MPKSKEPKIGQKIYVPNSLYLSHGRDDFAGGIATIDSIENIKTLPADHVNYTFVGIKERPGHEYNWKLLLKDQAKLKKQYGNRKAHADPDFHPSSNPPNDGYSVKGHQIENGEEPLLQPDRWNELSGADLIDMGYRHDTENYLIASGLRYMVWIQMPRWLIHQKETRHKIIL